MPHEPPIHRRGENPLCFRRREERDVPSPPGRRLSPMAVRPLPIPGFLNLSGGWPFAAGRLADGQNVASLRGRFVLGFFGRFFLFFFISRLDSLEHWCYTCFCKKKLPASHRVATLRRSWHISPWGVCTTGGLPGVFLCRKRPNLLEVYGYQRADDQRRNPGQRGARD